MSFFKRRKKLEDVRVVFIFKNFSRILGGNKYVMGLGIATLNTSTTLTQNGVDADMWGVVDEAELEAKLYEAQEDECQDPVDFVIISAPWISTAFLAELCCKFPKTTFVVNSHSNLGFLHADRAACELIRQYITLQKSVDNFQLAGNCRRFTAWATTVYGVNIEFLPNLYNIEGMKRKEDRWDGDRPLNIGIFGATRVLKNLLTQASAAAEVSKILDVPVNLYLSTGRSEGAGNVLANMKMLLKGLKGFHIHHLPWSPWPGFRTEAGKMDIGLQVSYTESFNMVAADMIYEGVPVVVSDAIDWAPKYWRAPADDANAIAAKAVHLLQNRCAVSDGQDALRDYVKNGIKQWKKFLLKK